MSRDTSFLNFFRAGAALWVVLAHCAIWGWGGIADIVEPKKAVDCFMVISGFLMIFTIDRAKDREPPSAWSTWRRFYLRRYFRIAPAYYLALAAVYVFMNAMVNGGGHLMLLYPERWGAAKAGHPDFSPLALVLHLTFLFGFLPRFSAVSGLPAWSLSVEMQFYLLFPLIYLAVRRWSFVVVCLALAGASLLFAHQYYHAVDAGRAAPYPEPSLLAFHLSKFVVGMLIYEAGRLQRRSLLIAGALVLLATAKVYGPPAVGLLAVVAALAACWYVGMPRWITHAFRSRAVTFLSDSSYSVYLIHNMLIDLVGWPILAWMVRAGSPLWVAQTALTLGVVATAYPAAYLLFLTVERAGIRLGKRAAHSRGSVAPPMT